MSSANESSRHIGQICFGFATSEKSAATTCRSSISSPGAFRVRIFPSPGRAQESTGIDPAYGERCTGSSRSFCRNGCSLRTSLCSALEALTGCSVTWRRRVTPAARWWWVLGTSERRTDGTESGSWATPTARDYKGGPDWARRTRKGASRLPSDQTLADQVEWPTPDAMVANDGEGLMTWLSRRERLRAKRVNGNGMGTPLTIAVQLWPTPTSSDANQSGAAGYSTHNGRHAGTTLTDATVGPRGPESRSTAGRNRGRLNPRWVAQLMGFPDGWLDIDEIA